MFFSFFSFSPFTLSINQYFIRSYFFRYRNIRPSISLDYGMGGLKRIWFVTTFKLNMFNIINWCFIFSNYRCFNLRFIFRLSNSRGSLSLLGSDYPVGSFRFSFCRSSCHTYFPLILATFTLALFVAFVCLSLDALVSLAIFILALLSYIPCAKSARAAVAVES